MPSMVRLHHTPRPSDDTIDYHEAPKARNAISSSLRNLQPAFKRPPPRLNLAWNVNADTAARQPARQPVRADTSRHATTYISDYDEAAASHAVSRAHWTAEEHARGSPHLVLCDRCSAFHLGDVPTRPFVIYLFPGHRRPGDVPEALGRSSIATIECCSGS